MEDEQEFQLGAVFDKLARDQSEWSQKAFGTDLERGPEGALKHLIKEAQEAIDSPGDPAEYADCLLLILDAARRAGFDHFQLINVAVAKLEICKIRKWPTPNGNEPVFHVKEDSTETQPLRELPPVAPEDLMQNDDAIEAVNQCDVILSLCDDIPEAGEDYATSVSEKVDSIRATIVRLDRVTPGQQTALDNMERGARNWVDREF